MNLSYLNIRQEYAKLNIEITNNQMQLQNAGKQVVVDAATPASQLDISREQGGLQIDSYPSRYARGQKNAADFSRDNAAEGLQALKALASEITQTTFALKRATRKNIIPQLAFNNSNIGSPAPGVTLNYVTRPSVEYTPDKLNFSYRPSDPQINFQTTQIENNTQPSSISYSLAQEPSVRMWVSQGQYDIYA